MTTADTHTQVRFLHPGSDLSEYIHWLGESHGVVALDVETTGLAVREPGFTVRQVAICGADGTGWVLDGEDKEMVCSALRSTVTAKPTWAHFASYDAQAIAAYYHVKLRGLRCSMTLVQSLRPQVVHAAGLKDLRPRAAQALGRLEAHCAAKGIVGRGKDWLPLAVAALAPDDPVLVEYVATDAIECARLVEEYVGNATPEQMQCAEIDLQTEDLWRWSAYRGIRVDQPFLEAEIERVAAERLVSDAQMGLDLGSDSDKTREWLYARGIRIVHPVTKNDTLSHKFWDSATVPAGSQSDWEAFKSIRTTVRAHNTLTKISNALEANGRVYPRINAIGAITGRQSISSPAVQNLPGVSRRLLLADEGMTLCSLDLDRVEPCVAAALSGDQALLLAIQIDLYAELAERLGISRSVAKTALLAQLYGQGARGLGVRLTSEGTPTTTEQAGLIVRGIRQAYPTLYRWMNQVEGRPAHLRTTYGRQLASTAEYARRGINWSVQGEAADIFKRAVLRTAASLPRDSSWLPVHDELVVQVPIGVEQETLAALKEGMTTTLAHEVAITGTPTVVGSAWAK